MSSWMWTQPLASFRTTVSFCSSAGGQHYPAARLELLEQVWRRGRRRCPDDDLVVGWMLPPAQRAVANADADIIVAQAAQTLLGLAGELLDDLDAPYRRTSWLSTAAW
jgi:hypothetical protein